MNSVFLSVMSVLLPTGFLIGSSYGAAGGVAIDASPQDFFVFSAFATVLLIPLCIVRRRAQAREQ